MHACCIVCSCAVAPAAAGVDIICSVVADHLPRSFFPTFRPSDPDTDGYLVQVLPSLQVYTATPCSVAYIESDLPFQCHFCTQEQHA